MALEKPRTRKQRRKRQQWRTNFYRARSCDGKLAFASMDYAAMFVARSLLKVPWVTRHGLRRSDPIIWGLNGYRCGFGNHFHLGHVRRDRPHLVDRLEKFRGLVLEKIAESIWPKVKAELSATALALNEAV